MRKRSRRGFTLIEILVVVVILTILATSVMLTVTSKPDEARVARSKADISTYETALEQFRLDMLRYPDEEEGLRALVRKPDSDDADRWRGKYVKRIEKDPWGNPYAYIYPGYYNPEGFDLVSYGADGQEGGEGQYDKDIGNWSEEDEELE
ncbi:MAG TPA: type II secretion system major pseudopilin GspG [Sumerlaeia bacterium]|nr:type II secretion system major pseudopilin GspG [Sumerlaeia bacterium]